MADGHDIVIRGGTVVDGTGGEPFVADVAIDAGRISIVGKVAGTGREEIDARGKLVTPGFVDLHTHYDAQVTWSSQITPSSWNGVTTAVIGNCGVGFAPCRPDQRDMLVKLMEGVEDIPEVVLTQGLPWNWQTFEDYLDALDARQYDLDVVTQVPHAALRVYVMGQRGADREPATPEDRARMAALAAAGIRAGALGFSTSRTLNHKTKAGIPIPTLKADEAELGEIAMAIGKLGTGWLQVISDFDEPEEEMALLRRLAERSGRPMSITVLQRDNKPEEWRRLMARMVEAQKSGAQIMGQVLPRPTGIMLGFEISQNPFSDRPSWKEIEDLPFADKMKQLVTADFRARLLSETGQSTESFSRRVSRWDRIFPLGDPPNYEPAAETSVAALAAREGRDPAEVAYDLLLEKGGKAILYRPLSNYTYGTLDTVHDMMCHEGSLIGLGDGGAHVGILSDASAITYLLTHWTRDRTRGPKLPLAWAIKRLTSDNARAIGLMDRGVIRRGAKADINIIDYDRLRLHAPEVVYDLPSGGRRLIQRIDGYEATLVSGEVVNREGRPTGRLPGRLVRGSRNGGMAEAAE
ncbi:MAG: amidohydrolase family protein [Hyphomicrobiaceae bacterium]|nr:amidohydrolase family protein [Hyphomicrobiaceae bacterium]